MVTKKEIDKVFDDLKQAGYIAYQNHMCCSTCGWEAIPKEAEKVVFYHAQNADAFKGKMLEYPLYLAWCGDGDEIVKIIENCGLEVQWSGSEDVKIAILP